MSISKDTDFNTFVRELKTLHWALTGGILLVGAVMTWQFTNFEIDLNYQEDYMILLAPILGLGGIVLGKRLFDQKVVELQNISDLHEKLQGYRAASILKFSLVEGPALVAVVLGMFNENFYYILVAGALLIYFFTLRVSKDRVKEELGMNP